MRYGLEGRHQAQLVALEYIWLCEVGGEIAGEFTHQNLYLKSSMQKFNFSENQEPGSNVSWLAWWAVSCVHCRNLCAVPFALEVGDWVLQGNHKQEEEKEKEKE